jgi:hypothetical protein
MNWKYPVTLAVFIGFLLSACKKSSDSNSGPAPVPVVEPLAVAAAKPKDTLTIKGENFSTTASGNVVKIGNEEATVVSATATEIKTLIPMIQGIYYITVTTNGKTIEVGSILITPLTFYMIKGVFANGYECHLMSVNPQDGKETLMKKMYNTERINDIVYNPATNELIGVNPSGSLLVNLNAAYGYLNGAYSLPYSATSATGQLVIDKNNNLYGIKYDWTTANHQLQSLIKIDPKIGTSTVIKTFESNDNWYEPVYVPATNDIVGLMNDGKRLFKVNLTTKDTAGVYLPGSAEAKYRELIVDDKSNLYAYKGTYAGNGNNVAKLVKVDAATGQEKVLMDLPVNGKFHDKIIFVPALNEFIGTSDQQSLYRINATSFSLTEIPLNTGSNYTYSYFTTN